MSYNPPPSLPYISDLIEKYEDILEIARDNNNHWGVITMDMVISDLKELRDTLIPERFKDR